MYLAVTWLAIGLSSVVGGVSSAQEPELAAEESRASIIRDASDHYRFDVDGRGERRLSREVSILSAAGLAEWSQIAVPYSADRERARLSKLQIHKADGTLVTPVNVETDDRRISGLFAEKVFSDLTVLHVTVPSLAVGDRLAYEVTVDVREPQLPGRFWLGHAFATDAVVDRASLVVDVPAALAVRTWTDPDRDIATDDVTSGERRVMRWTHRQTTPDRAKVPTSIEEALVVRHDEAMAHVLVGSFAEWRDVAQWYGSLIDATATPDATVTARARSLTAGATTPIEQLTRLHDFVARDIRYVSLSFGAGAYEPRTPALVLETGYGDCKDKHALLAAMAHTIGVTVDAVLIPVSTGVVDAVPSPGQFDHVVSVWRPTSDPADWRWMDTTSGVTPLGALLPNLRNKQALLVADGSTGPFVTTRLADAYAESLVEIEEHVGPDGTATIRVSRTLSGDAAALVRLVSAAGDPVEAATQSLEHDQLRDAQVTRSDMDLGDTLAAPVRWTYEATRTWDMQALAVRGLVSPAATALTTFDPAMIDATTWRIPIDVRAREVVRSAVVLPEGWVVEAPVALEFTRPFGVYRASYEIDGPRLSLERVLDLPGVSVEQHDRVAYEALRRTVEQDGKQAFRVRAPLNVTTAVVPDATTDAPRWYAAGEAAYSRGRYAEAVDLFGKALETEPRHLRALEFRGVALLGARRMDEALAAFDALAAAEPNHEAAYAHRAGAFVMMGRWDEAERAFRQQLDISPLSHIAHRGMGLMYLIQGRHRDAIASLSKARSLKRDDAMTGLSLARAHASAGETDAMLAVLREVAEVPKVDADVLRQAALMLADSGAHVDIAVGWARTAAASMEQRANETPREGIPGAVSLIVTRLASAWDALGWALFRSGSVSEGRDWLESADALGDGAAAFHLGIVHEAAGDTDAARRAHARALMSAPWMGVDQARTALARLAGDGAQALIAQEQERDLGMRRHAMPGRGPAGHEERVLFVVSPQGVVEDVRPVGDADLISPLLAQLQALVPPAADVARRRAVRLLQFGGITCGQDSACEVSWEAWR